MLAIDPATDAKKQAYAFIRLEPKGDRKLVLWGRCNLEALARGIEKADIVVCEGQWVGFPPPGGSKAWRMKTEGALDLCCYRGRIWQMAVDRGKEWRVVAPSAWMRLLNAPKRAKEGKLKELQKQLARMEINYSTGAFPKEIQEDEAAAICIGVYQAGVEQTAYLKSQKTPRERLLEKAERALEKKGDV